jgi:Transposase DDE domain
MVKDTTKSLKATEQYKLSNWSAYNESLKKRGSLTIWFDDNVKYSWLYNGKQKPGGETIYSDIAIEFCLTVRSLSADRRDGEKFNDTIRNELTSTELYSI